MRAASSNQPDAVIIGAGVIGCSIALALAREGRAVTCIDALPAPGYGSTSHSSAIVRPFYSHVTSCAIAHEARFRWLEWQKFLGGEDPSGYARYTESGGLVLVAEGAQDDYRANLDILDAVGVEYQLLDASGVSRLYPGVCLDCFGPPRRMEDSGFAKPNGRRLAGGIYIPAAGYVSDPQLAAHNLYSAAMAVGARFQFMAQVSEVRRDGERVAGVTLASGEQLSTPVVINAAGPHSFVINRLAGIDEAITTRPHRHEVAYLKAPPGYVENGNGFVVDADSGTYQRADGADILIGSADPACDPRDIIDPDEFDSGFTQQWMQQVYRAAQRFPALGIENRARGTVGLYDVSEDWIPLYDRTEVEGFYLAIGTSGNQFKNAPLVGELMAAVIAACENGRDHDLHPAKLALARVGRTVDLSFYSRNREIQKTRSVMA
ncbi:MAG: FAD-dependent oxidoreductase [Pseudomonadales bacterium]|mgnify:CR=1 FL=1|jgi:sarcosine oxidase subunit beta|nr:FAD-dependent oxidoreductase [Pseudomonadales bacterium]MDP6473170.1 FAD-dependent oxidoreductase [Pseudomonadales bacterium]MDP6826073.1 FAD-dependent oxidoreductase [Pseudomonadales bacterium]MDP6970394.1 FAD-dependent oxidoreductase [Pseudomonadales bacterium]